MNESIHVEVQYIKQKYLTILVYFVALLPITIFIIGIVMQMGYGVKFGDGNMSNSGLLVSGIISVIFSLAILLLFSLSNLRIEVRVDGFYYKYTPFHITEKKIGTNDIENVYLKKLSPLGDFGGWGIRYGFGKKGKGYVVEGNIGVQFLMKNGKKVFFSTIEPSKMQQALDKVFKIDNYLRKV